MVTELAVLLSVNQVLTEFYIYPSHTYCVNMYGEIHQKTKAFGILIDFPIHIDTIERLQMTSHTLSYLSCWRQPTMFSTLS